ncbi:MAG: hypothetical protein JW797_08565 [Bradymonadales bacterium]|nr:hypothetical protein [Bradymonadales bacterium]
MDTSKDIRIAFLEKVIGNLTAQATSGFFGPVKKKPQVQRGLQEIGNLLIRLKYSYLDEAALAQSPEQDSLIALADPVLDELETGAGDNREKQAMLRFYRLTIHRFHSSFRRAPTVDSAIAVAVGKVVTVTRHPKASGLILCHVDVFGETLTLVTNLVKTRPGQPMKVAMVPPAPVMNILSEAQFVGEATEAMVGQEEVPLTEDETQEIRRSVSQYFG